MTPGGRAVLDPGDLDRMLAGGEVDTVICALPDLWGRLVGKRVTARTFRRLMREGGGLNASLYLFVVDMDMEPLPGFALSDWERGFQDFLMVPDLSTLRLVPWLEKTALVLAGIEQQTDPPPVTTRNAYTDHGAPPVPSSLQEAVAEFETSKLASAAFGAEVHQHLALLGRHELAAFSSQPADAGPADQARVTPWELRRYFERG